MATTFYLIRHGETEWNRRGRWQGHADVPLNEVGRAQARRLARRLLDEDIRFDHMYASDLSRAFETAQIIAQALETLVQPLRDLREIDIGMWSGLTRTEITTRWPGAFETVLHPPNGEPREAFGVRVGSALLRLAEQHPGAMLALVTHGGSIRAMLQQVYALQGRPEQPVPTIGNTSICEVRRDADGWHIVRLNDLAHVAEAQAPDMLAPQKSEGNAV